MADTGDGEGRRQNIGQPDCIIIREIYEDEEAQEHFEQELERALEAQAKTIIIEPSKLGDETARWITVGNCLHKTTVVAGICSMAAMHTWPDRGYVYLPLGFISVTCAGVYAISWQFDPCCKYQPEHNPSKLDRLPLYNLTSTAPVVLVRRNDYRRKVLHNIVALVTGGLCAWKINDWFFKS